MATIENIFGDQCPEANPLGLFDFIKNDELDLDPDLMLKQMEHVLVRYHFYEILDFNQLSPYCYNLLKKLNIFYGHGDGQYSEWLAYSKSSIFSVYEQSVHNKLMNQFVEFLRENANVEQLVEIVDCNHGSKKYIMRLKSIPGQFTVKHVVLCLIFGRKNQTNQFITCYLSRSLSDTLYDFKGALELIDNLGTKRTEYLERFIGTNAESVMLEYLEKIMRLISSSLTENFGLEYYEVQIEGVSGNFKVYKEQLIFDFVHKCFQSDETNKS